VAALRSVGGSESRQPPPVGSHSARGGPALASSAGGDEELMEKVGELLQVGSELLVRVDDELAQGLIDSLLHYEGGEGEEDEDSADGGTALGALVLRYARMHAWEEGQVRTGPEELGWEKRMLRPGLRQHMACTGDRVCLHFVCTLASGQEIDSSYKRNRPVSATLGAADELGARLIRGWDQGIVGMCLGEKVQLKVKATAAYASRGGMDRVSPGADLTFEVELVELNGHAVEGIKLPSARSEATTVQSDQAPILRESETSATPVRQDRALLFQPQPPDESPVVRIASVDAITTFLRHALQPQSLVRQVQADACHVTQELVEQTVQLLARLTPCDARALVQDTLLAPALPAPDPDARATQAVCEHLRSFIAEALGTRDAKRMPTSCTKWYRTPAAVGRAVIRSVVQALDDHSPLVRAAASRALVSVALEACSATAEPPRFAGPAPSRSWHAVVVSEVLERIRRATPQPPTTVSHEPGNPGVEAAGDAGKVWMDASRIGGTGCQGIAVSNALHALTAIFRNRRLVFGRARDTRDSRTEYTATETETKVLEKEAVEAILRGLADSDVGVREAALSGVQGHCLDPSTRAVHAVLSGLGNDDDTSAEGSMYRGRPWLSGRSLQATTRAAYVRATGALSAGPHTTWGAGSLGPSAPDVHGPVCEKWLAGWCQASGVRNSQPLVILDALHAAAPLVNGRGDQAAGGGRKEAEKEMLGALRGALPIKSTAAAASSSSSLAYGRVREMAWKPARGVPQSGAESGAWEEAGRVLGVVKSLGHLGPLGSSSASIAMVLKAADSTDAGVRRGAVQSLARIIVQEHLALPASTAVPATSNAQRVGLPLGPSAQAPTIGWDRGARGGEMMAVLVRLAADPVPQVAAEAAAHLARCRARLASGGSDLAWACSGKSGCEAWGTDAATTDAQHLRSGYFGSAPVWGAKAAHTRAQVRSLTGCSYLSKYGVGPLHTHSRLPLAKSNSKVGRTTQVVYPHVIAMRNEHFAAGSVPVGNVELSNLDASTAQREAIIQKPRALWAAAHST
jgi:hypothetical protein